MHFFSVEVCVVIHLIILRELFQENIGRNHKDSGFDAAAFDGCGPIPSPEDIFMSEHDPFGHDADGDGEPLPHSRLSKLPRFYQKNMLAFRALLKHNLVLGERLDGNVGHESGETAGGPPGEERVVLKPFHLGQLLQFRLVDEHLSELFLRKNCELAKIQALDGGRPGLICGQTQLPEVHAVGEHRLPLQPLDSLQFEIDGQIYFFKS
jgi:hypothetical protein